MSASAAEIIYHTTKYLPPRKRGERSDRMIRFTVPGKPQGKARVRIVYNPQLKRSLSYTPENTILYENLIKTRYLEVTDKKYDNKEPLHISITAFYEPPKSVSKKRREAMLAGYEKPCKKPDIDNIAKVILDALNDIAYHDDTQVISLSMQKKYSEEAKVEVEISPVLEAEYKAGAGYEKR